MQLALDLRMNLADGFGRFVVHGGQLFLLYVGFEVDSPFGWLLVAIGIALLSIIGWLLALRRWRAIGDTPTSQVATAAQGYTELTGQGMPLEGLPLVSPLNARPCLWFRYTVETKNSEGKWRHERT